MVHRSGMSPRNRGAVPVVAAEAEPEEPHEP